MKWRNRGHEFDALGEYFQEVERILIYGNNIEGKNAYQQLRWLHLPVKMVKASGEKLNSGIFGIKKAFHAIQRKEFNLIKRRLSEQVGGVKRALPIEYVASNRIKDAGEKSIVVISLHMSEWKLRDFASKHGLEYMVNVFPLRRFLKVELPIYLLYNRNITYAHGNDLVCTTRCTLNCEKCLDFVPYNKHREDISFVTLKRDIDAYFHAFDYVGEFGLTGGETFLNRDLPKLITYISKTYGKRIYHLYCITNGTVLPSDELCASLKKYNIGLKIDDYTKMIPKTGEKLKQVLSKLDAFGVKYDLVAFREWFDLFPPKEDMSGLTSRQLEMRYNMCNHGFMELRGKRLCTCNYVGFAATAGVVEEDQTDYYDLSAYDVSKKNELIEFRLGYSEKGYTKFCAYCNGFPSINKYGGVPAAKQAKGFLEWNQT